LGLNRFHHQKGLTVTYFLASSAVLAALAGLYALVARPWLKRQNWTADFFAWIEPFEIALFKKSETVLVGRLLWVGGLFVTFYDAAAIFLSSLDLTPITTRLFDFVHVPPDMRGVATTAFITALGYLINWLRKRTTKPLEVVAVASKDVTPAVASALVVAEAAKDDAVAAVQEAKAA
jgi:hypothetical protein